MTVFSTLLICARPDLVPGQTEDDRGALAGPVDHQVQVRVVQVKDRTVRKGLFTGTGDSGRHEMQEKGDQEE